MKQFNFTQTSPASLWTITHNLGVADLATDTFVDQGGVGVNPTKILPQSVVMTDSNTLTITFSTNQTGTVRIVAG